MSPTSRKSPNAMPSDAVWVAGIVAFSTIANLLINSRTRRKEKREDWARQDEVARRVEKVAVDVHESQGNVVGRLEQIHTLVNTGRANDKKQNLGLLRQLMARDERDGIPITQEMNEAVSQLEDDIAEIERATALGEAQAGTAHA